jgi:hypothetical protein
MSISGTSGLLSMMPRAHDYSGRATSSASVERHHSARGAVLAARGVGRGWLIWIDLVGSLTVG